MRYDISTDSNLPHLLSIILTIQSPASRLVLKLPKWRPGRYTYANYAPFIQDLEVHHHAARYSRSSPYQWDISLPEHLDEIRISYSFFPNTPNAGGSYFDKNSFLLNPINCLLYSPELVDKSCTLSLPEHYQYFTQLQSTEKNIFLARDYQHLADSPVIGQSLESESLITSLYSEEVQVNFVEVLLPESPSAQGEIMQLKPVIDAQIKLFGDCPVAHYDFLFFPTKGAVRHGVEHEASSLLVMGPPSTFTKPEIKKSLLELSSHEFFHTWNVKNIRPKAFLPYNFDQLDDSPLHYVTEGVTTYYGDLMIWKAGVWSLDDWINSMNGELWRFFSNPARLHTSLRQASLESAMNGYNDKGVPHRRVSFYNKGYLVAMLLDHLIREDSGDKHSLDDVMRRMYQDFGKTKTGYTEEDFWNTVSLFTKADLEAFKADYIFGKKDLSAALKKIANRTGLQIQETPYLDPLIRDLGVVTEILSTEERMVTYVYQEGLGKKEGLQWGDVITAINGESIASLRTNYHSMQEAVSNITLTRAGEIITCKFPAPDKAWSIPQFAELPNPSPEQTAAQEAWKSI